MRLFSRKSRVKKGESLIAHLIELDLAAEDPVDAEGIGQHKGHTQAGDGERYGEEFLRAGGVVDGEPVFGDGGWNKRVLGRCRCRSVAAAPRWPHRRKERR